jgi:cation transport regulator ChaB
MKKICPGPRKISRRHCAQMAKNQKEVNIELFIGEVINYPEIWNVAVETYHDREKKRGDG